VDKEYRIMASLGNVRSRTGKQYQLFTSVSEAQEYINTHAKGKYDYKPITVYGVFLKKRKEK